MVSINDGFVSGDGWISDESEFYGTARKRRKLEMQISGVSVLQLVREWQRQQQVNPVAAIVLKQTPVERPLQNPYEGHSYMARQLSETIPDFVKRMPPLTSSGDGSWIWIANPVVKGKGNGNNNGKDRFDLANFQDLGVQLLENFDAKRTQIESENVGKVQSTITRKLGPHRDKLKEDILDIAIKHGVTSGKWMLFPKEEEVNRTWLSVCEAVADDRLGSGAKVAIADHSRASSSANATSKVRLICVYTRDFSDLEDVRRVLDELCELGLAPREGNGIYYKCDAYTHLGIESDNKYKLKASLYSSRELLKMSRPTAKGKAVATAAKEKTSGNVKTKGGSLEGWSF